ncbi:MULTISPECIES: hypothetical protein [unclassified Duganella]|uniref:hypothetical protein n=1 Tax=unclassified Duganella TaxID=2636909 RepID=UPI000888DC2D|nr:MULTISPECIES: hypothetical protein [unclassified Duganella]SDG06603.1 hypothetical protein SAMN05216320_102542 [Duganella sp. OV458]SDI98574.1 hypothetical protein SAMN05428973_1029 [Duganella sp. OV510]
MSKEFMRGASASLNKTISEIESILAGEKIEKSGKLRKKLREKLKEMLEEVAMDWVKHGFKGGHAVAARDFVETQAFPRNIEITVTRQFPLRKVSKKSRQLTLKSKIPKKYAGPLDEME